MTIRFKFRSSRNFDVLDIQGRSSISVRDLKSRIIRFKNLNSCQDCDFVLFDFLTCTEYVNENVEIPDGSSVIIKRVPSESVHQNIVRNLSNTRENVRINEPVIPIPFISTNVETVDFDDFGDDLYPIPKAALSSSYLSVNKKTSADGDSMSIGIAKMCSKPSVRWCRNFEAGDVSDTIPQRLDHNRVEGYSFQKMELNAREEMKKVERVKAPTLQNDKFLSELKCSVCNSFFKEAVMIPCCQHSFCYKCINRVLRQNAGCPKCLSTKCRVEDLLPNLSLRQAIEYLRDFQLIGSGNDILQHAPDGESGTHGKQVLCGVSVHRRSPESPHSLSESERGSNHVVMESHAAKSNASKHGVTNEKLPPLLHQVKQINKSLPQDLVDFDDFHGESQPMHEEVESKAELKKKLCLDNEGGCKSSVETGRLEKDARTCYMCGSPDHLVRDCPDVICSRPMLQTGNAMLQGSTASYIPYWNASPMLHVNPYGSPYANCGMMPFNARIVPTSPYTVPTYITSMYRPMPAFQCPNMGGVQSRVGTSEDHSCHFELLDTHDCAKRLKLSDQNYRRESHFDAEGNEEFSKIHRVADKETSNELKPGVINEYHHKSYGSSVGGRDQRQNHCPNRPSSGVDDQPCISREHHISFKRLDAEKERRSTDFRRHPQAKSRGDFHRKRPEQDVKRHNQNHHKRNPKSMEVPNIPRISPRANCQAKCGKWSADRMRMVQKNIGTING